MKMENVATAPVGEVADARAAALRKRKAIALSLLVIAAIGLVACTYFGRLTPHWGFGLGAAACEAALVGGLADWFAVVALFRHPLGLPIPHTAIIPKKKDALGQSLADFVSDNFLGTSQVTDRLRKSDLAGAIAGKLADDTVGRVIGEKITSALPAIVRALDSDDLHRFVHDLVRDRLQQTDVSSLAAAGLAHLTAGGKHHELVDGALAYVGEALQSPQTRQKLGDGIREDWGTVLSALDIKDYFSDKLADKLIAGMANLVTDMAGDRNHELRRKLEAEFNAFIARLQTDAELRDKIAQIRDQWLAEESGIGQYLKDLWKELATWIEHDAARPDSAIAARIASIATDLGRRLKADQDMRNWFNDTILAIIEPQLEDFREFARKFIVEQIGKWSAEELTRELELSVGTDLQYIRYNGTAIGAVIGAALYAVLHLPALLA